MSNIWFTSDTHYGHAGIIRYCRRPFSTVEEMDAAMIRNWNACVGPDDDVYHTLPGRHFASRRNVERVGDFSFLKPARSEAILHALRGRKHLVHGNHDSEEIRGLPAWTSSQPYLEIAPLDISPERNVCRATGHGFTPKIVLCHYAMKMPRRSEASTAGRCSALAEHREAGNRSHKGAWMLFGHSHGEFPLSTFRSGEMSAGQWGDSQSMDVGVDALADRHSAQTNAERQHHFRPVSLKEVALKLARLPEHKDVRRRRDEGEGR